MPLGPEDCSSSSSSSSSSAESRHSALAAAALLPLNSTCCDCCLVLQKPPAVIALLVVSRRMHVFQQLFNQSTLLGQPPALLHCSSTSTCSLVVLRLILQQCCRALTTQPHAAWYCGSTLYRLTCCVVWLVHHDAALAGVQVALELLAGVGVGWAGGGALHSRLADTFLTAASRTCANEQKGCDLVSLHMVICWC
jgi:hypothetical protein